MPAGSWQDDRFEFGYLPQCCPLQARTLDGTGWVDLYCLPFGRAPWYILLFDYLPHDSYIYSYVKA